MFRKYPEFSFEFDGQLMAQEPGGSTSLELGENRAGDDYLEWELYRW